MSFPADHLDNCPEPGARFTAEVELSASDITDLRVLAERCESTVWAVLVSALAILLRRYTGEDKFVVGVAAEVRPETETDATVARPADPVAHAIHVDGCSSVEDLIAHVQAQLARGGDGGDSVPGVALVYESPRARRFGVDKGASPRPTRTVSRIAANVSVVDTGDELSVCLDADGSRYEATSVRRIAANFLATLRSLASRPTTAVDAIEVISSEERHLLLDVWNDTSRPYPGDLGLHVLINRIVENYPDGIAVRRGNVALTYKELGARVNRLARHLQRAGARPGVVVAIQIESSVDMVVAVLATLSTGAAYLPVDGHLPSERQQFMLSDAAAALIVTSSSEDASHHGDRPETIGECRVVDVTRARAAIESESSDPVMASVAGDDVAYVMYTSGSTGRPKGVRIPHRGVARLFLGTTSVDWDQSVRFLQLAPLSFDASVVELFAPLLHGGTVVLSDPRLHFVDRFLDAVKRDAPNAALLISPQLHLLIDHHLDALSSLRQLLFGGDVVSVDHLRRATAAIGGSTRFVHCYGPTESTVYATCVTVNRVPDEGQLPIGRPIDNSQAFVLDDKQRLLPIGAEGEICLGGDGLALGYLNRPDLTAAAFVAHPFATEAGERLYRTGDRGRLLANGEIEFLGRNDDQVKIRGYRIELGEVEATLQRHPDVLQVAVVPQPAARDRMLVAYVVPVAEKLSISSLREHMRENLADYMCPSAYVRLDRLPMTDNGKLDRRALPAPFRSDAHGAESGSHIELQVAAAFRDVLQLDAVGLDDDFFDIGGTSLMLVELHLRLDEAFPDVLTITDVFEAGTVHRIAEALGRAVGPDQQQAGRARGDDQVPGARPR